MENSVIAVQIANGTFVPVLNTSSRKRRRLTVTTVRDNQENVKIELFRGSDESMGDAEHIGSLVIDHVGPGPGGSPDIAVLLGVDENGNLNATATDTTSGEYQSLSVGLETIGLEGGSYDVPDFQLSDEELTLDELSLDDESDLESDGEPATDADGDALGNLSFEELEEEEGDLDLSALNESDESDEIHLDEVSLAGEPEESEEEDAVAMGSLDDLELETGTPTQTDDEPDAIDELDELTLDSEPAAEPSLEASDEASLDDLTFDEADAEAPEDISLEEISLDEPAEAAEPDEPDESSDFDAFAASLEEESAPSTDEPPSEPEPEAIAAGAGGAEVDDFSFDELEEEEFSFEPLEEPAAEDATEAPALDAGALDAGALDEEAAADEPSFDSFDTSFDEEPSGGDDENVFAGIADEEFTLDESFATEEGGGETEFGAGMVEADLGEEDFTFDEGGDELPVGEPGEALPEAGELSDEEFDRLDSEPIPHPADEEAEEPLQPRKSNAVIFVGYLILALAALGVLTYLIFRLMEGPPAPPLRATLSGYSFALVAFAVPRLRRRHRS